MNWTYFWIDFLTILGPILLSFDKKVAFFKKIKHIIPAILIPGSLYLLWDFFFTRVGVWSFNPKYILGVYIINLPLEEVVFFFCIPYACLFIYECLRVYIPRFKSKLVAIVGGWILVLASILAVWQYHNQLYTAITFLLLFVTVLNHLWVTRGNYFGYTLFAWAISIVPMFIVNGILTSLPIVIYNNEQNMGIRIGSIPVEDFFYNLLLMIWVIWIYERQKQRAEQKQSTTV